MKTLKAIYFIGLVTGIAFIMAPAGWGQSKPAVKGPVIINCYALDKGVYGTIWKIYIEADAGDIAMGKVAVVVDQSGYGRYPADFILLDPQFRDHLIGYLQWNTLSSRGTALREGTQIALRVTIIDKAGNQSNEMVLPFTFVSEGKDQDELPAPFDQENIPRLGHISIDLIGQESGGH